jgi:hypothetical protein
MVGASRGDPRLPHRGLRTAPAAANPLALRKGKLVRFSASEIGPFVSQAAACFANGHRQGERWLPAACRGTSKTGNGSGFADSEQQQTSRSVALRFVPIVQLAPAQQCSAGLAVATLLGVSQACRSSRARSSV